MAPLACPSCRADVDGLVAGRTGTRSVQPGRSPDEGQPFIIGNKQCPQCDTPLIFTRVPTPDAHWEVARSFSS
jgi:hypothetical protein